MPTDLALLFDLDGTLVVADHLHFAAFRALLAEFGRTLSQEEFDTRMVGGTNEQIMRDFFPDLPVSEHLALAERKEQAFRASARSIAPVRGVVALLDWADAEGIATAVVTNAPRANAELMLDGAGIGGRIRTVVVADELAHGKPHPLPYLTAVEMLGATEALAFEDSRAGIRAARAAGLYTFGLRTSLTAEALREAGANDVIDDFTAPNLWDRLNSRGSAP